jgi:predicted nucleic acid-binding protein
VNSEDSVVSDSSFYIAFLSPHEIGDPETLVEILKKYRFFIGRVVLDEISEKHGDIVNDIGFNGMVKILENYDYSSLLSIIGNKVFEKGEYECMAIAYFLYRKSGLHSLILDDKSARRWVNNNIPELSKFVRYSLRFIVNCCCSDGKLSEEKVNAILNKVVLAIRMGRRPFNLTERNIYVVDQLLDEVDGCQN